MATTSFMTFADFEQMPDAPGKQELLNGELIVSPPPKNTHSKIAQRVFRILQSRVEEPRLWLEAGYKIGEGWLQPDVSVSWPDQQIINDYMQMAPMIAIEVASTSNTAEQLDQKIAAYLGNGGGEVWVIYPKTRSMMVHRPGGDARRITDVYESPLGGSPLHLTEIFSS